MAGSVTGGAQVLAWGKRFARAALRFRRLEKHALECMKLRRRSVSCPRVFVGGWGLGPRSLISFRPSISPRPLGSWQYGRCAHAGRCGHQEFLRPSWSADVEADDAQASAAGSWG
eukprot:50565-Alexandrium_andersonii.AAC.1